MNEVKRKPNISLIVGLTIPVAMILFIAAGIYLPRLFTTVDPPRFDYLYGFTQQDPYRSFMVRDGRLVAEQRPVPSHYNAPEGEPQFFIHDVETNKSREINLDEARKLELDSSTVSPDGYALERGRRSSWFPFDYGYDYRRQYLVNGYYAEEQHLQADRAGSAGYYGNVRFLGWIVDSPARTGN